MFRLLETKQGTTFVEAFYAIAGVTYCLMAGLFRGRFGAEVFAAGAALLALSGVIYMFHHLVWFKPLHWEVDDLARKARKKERETETIDMINPLGDRQRKLAEAARRVESWPDSSVRLTGLLNPPD